MIQEVKDEEKENKTSRKTFIIRAEYQREERGKKPLRHKERKGNQATKMTREGEVGG